MAFGQLDRGNTAQPMSEINMTPLVDVMLVLLIIFIVTAPLLTHNVKVNLPKAQTTASTIQDPMKVSLTRDAQLFLDGALITHHELEALLRQQIARGAQPTIELRADGEIAYQHVASLMALIQRTGATRLSFVMEPAKNEAPVPAP
jgi:biopolymer transport protein ExbD